MGPTLKGDQVILISKDPQKGAVSSNYCPTTCLSITWKVLSGIMSGGQKEITRNTRGAWSQPRIWRLAIDTIQPWLVGVRMRGRQVDPSMVSLCLDCLSCRPQRWSLWRGLVSGGAWSLKGPGLWRSLVSEGAWSLEEPNIWRRLVSEGAWTLKGPGLWRNPFFQSTKSNAYVSIIEAHTWSRSW